MEDKKNIITDEEVEKRINTETRTYDEEITNEFGTMRTYKIIKLSDYPNLTEQELSIFNLKNIENYDDLKEQVRKTIYEEKKI